MVGAVQWLLGNSKYESAANRWNAPILLVNMLRSSIWWSDNSEKRNVGVRPMAAGNDCYPTEQRTDRSQEARMSTTGL